MTSHVASPELKDLARDLCVSSLSPLHGSLYATGALKGALSSFVTKCYNAAILALLLWDFCECSQLRSSVSTAF